MNLLSLELLLKKKKKAALEGMVLKLEHAAVCGELV